MATAPFIAVKFVNSTISSHGDVTIAMGNYGFTSPDSAVTNGEYAFGHLETKGGPKIVLHHSSLPFSHG